MFYPFCSGKVIKDCLNIMIIGPFCKLHHKLLWDQLLHYHYHLYQLLFLMFLSNSRPFFEGSLGIWRVTRIFPVWVGPRPEAMASWGAKELLPVKLLILASGGLIRIPFWALEDMKESDFIAEVSPFNGSFLTRQFSACTEEMACSNFKISLTTFLIKSLSDKLQNE